MQTPTGVGRVDIETTGLAGDTASAVSWAAIFAGTFATMAIMFVFLALGSGLGLASVTSFHAHVSASHFTYITATWLILTQWVSAAIGGYITGRLRTRWTGVHTHEVFFRDTAHGFLTWATATVCYTSILLLLASSLAVGTAQLLGDAHASPDQPSYMQDMGANAPDAVDGLFRTDTSTPVMDADTKAQVTRLILKGVKDGGLSNADRTYLGQLIATRTTLSPTDFVVRADDAVGEIRNALDTARKTAASVSIFTALSMMIGAFVACIAAALGGLRRDERPIVAL
jgi:hypothetical protein